ncbi:MAG: hypothetical protein QW754_06575, partial [Thermoplasmata archaeon]
IKKIDSKGYPLLNSNGIDFIPRNIILNNEMSSIDNEWICKFSISADYILFRALFIFIVEQYAYITNTLSIPNNNIDVFIISIIKMFYPQYDIDRHEFNRNIEKEFQGMIYGNNIELPTDEQLRIVKDLILQKEEKIKEKEEQIKSLLNSWSWKITKPLRWIYGGLIKIRDN